MIAIQCPKCSRRLKVNDSMAGKRGRCPSCGEVMSIGGDSAQVDATPAPLPSKPSTDAGTTSPSEAPSPAKRSPMPAWAMPYANRQVAIAAAVALLIGLTAGYFGGRAYMRHQIASAFQSAAEQLGQGLADGMKSAFATAEDDESPEDKARRVQEERTRREQEDAERLAQSQRAQRSRELVSVELVSINTAGGWGPKLTFRLKNTSGKAMSAVSGSVQLQDQFGDHLAGLAVKLDAPLADGATVEESGSWMIGARASELLTKQSGTVGMAFHVKQVVWPDGTREEFD